MPGKGNPIAQTRLPRDLYAQMEQQIEASLPYLRSGSWDTAEFIRRAVREKLAKMKRSREWRRKSKAKKKVEVESGVDTLPDYVVDCQASAGG